VTIHVDPIEAIWIVMNLSAVVITAASFVEAYRRLVEARRLNGKHAARRLVAGSNTRREGMRWIAQALLLALVLPGLFLDRPVTLNPLTAALIAISAVLLVQTILDTRDRYRLNDILEDPVPVSTVALEESVQTNIALTKAAGDKAEAAYHEANTVNEKIAVLTEALGHKEDKA
jgi:hypothetical protein